MNTLITRYTDVLARLRALMPHVEEIAAVVAEVVPVNLNAGHRRRFARWLNDGDAALAEVLSLPQDIGHDFQRSIEALEDLLEETREAVKEELREELREAEARASELRRQLGETTPAIVQEAE